MKEYCRMTYITPGELNLLMMAGQPMMCAHAWWLIAYRSYQGATELIPLGSHILRAKYVLGPGDIVLVPSGAIIYDSSRRN